MIRKVPSLVVAEAVLNLVQNHQDAYQIDCFVDCYQNGREQGYLLWGYGPKGIKGIYIAECRNSDQIVVYVGSYAMHGISEDAYNHKDYFDHNNFDDASNFIIEQAKTLFPSNLTYPATA